MATNVLPIALLGAAAAFLMSRKGDEEGEGEGEGNGNGPPDGGDCGSQTPGYLQYPRLDGWGTPRQPTELTIVKGETRHINLFGATGPRVVFGDITSTQDGDGPSIIKLDYDRGEPCPPEDTETPGIVFITGVTEGVAYVTIPGDDGSTHAAQVTVTPPPDQ